MNQNFSAKSVCVYVGLSDIYVGQIRNYLISIIYTVGIYKNFAFAYRMCACVWVTGCLKMENNGKTV